MDASLDHAYQLSLLAKDVKFVATTPRDRSEEDPPIFSYILNTVSTFKISHELVPPDYVYCSYRDIGEHLYEIPAKLKENVGKRIRKDDSVFQSFFHLAFVTVKKTSDVRRNEPNQQTYVRATFIADYFQYIARVNRMTNLKQGFREVLDQNRILPNKDVQVWKETFISNRHENELSYTDEKHDEQVIISLLDHFSSNGSNYTWKALKTFLGQLSSRVNNPTRPAQGTNESQRTTVTPSNGKSNINRPLVTRSKNRKRKARSQHQNLQKKQKTTK